MRLPQDSKTLDVTPRIPAELAQVIEVGARANRIVPEGVALGGSVCALYAQHRTSIDIDFVLPNLNGQFDEVRERLFNQSGWVEARISRPTLILGSLDQVEVGFRQLRHKTPIATQSLETEAGFLTIPTLEELLTTKAFLAYNRNATRDYFDFAELASLRSQESVVNTLLNIDAKMGWERLPSVLLEVTKALVHCEPRYLGAQGIETFRVLNPRLKSWEVVKSVCQSIGRLLAEKAIGGASDGP